MPGTEGGGYKDIKYVSLNLFSLVPKRGASVGDIGKANTSNRLVRHRAHEQKLVAAPDMERDT